MRFLRSKTSGHSRLARDLIARGSERPGKSVQPEVESVQAVQKGGSEWGKVGFTLKSCIHQKMKRAGILKRQNGKKLGCPRGKDVSAGLVGI